jgi:hypothetical protein
MRRLPPDDQLTDFNTLLGRGKYRACQILTCTTALKTILYYFYSVNPGMSNKRFYILKITK